MFSIGGLAAGRYSAALEPPAGGAAAILPSEFELKDARACVELSAVARSTAVVRGRIVDAAGQAIPGLTVDLTVPEGIDRNPGAERLRTLTRGDGTFELTGVPDGRFILGLNTTRESTPRLIYPGVDSLRGAKLVTVRVGGRNQAARLRYSREHIVRGDPRCGSRQHRRAGCRRARVSCRAAGGRPHRRRAGDDRRVWTIRALSPSWASIQAVRRTRTSWFSEQPG